MKSPSGRSCNRRQYNLFGITNPTLACQLPTYLAAYIAGWLARLPACCSAGQSTRALFAWLAILAAYTMAQWQCLADSPASICSTGPRGCPSPAFQRLDALHLEAFRPAAQS